MPKTVVFRGQRVTTGIFKEPVAGPVRLATSNLAGDGQADLTVHGGRDKALYAYSLDAYPAWRARRPHDTFVNGAFGENLSMDALAEHTIAIGDVYALGGAFVQVTQPRLPCFKLGVKFDDPAILQAFMQMARPGVYFRVQSEGDVDVGDTLELVSREPVRVLVSEVFALAAGDPVSDDLCERVLRVEAMPDQWRKKAERTLAARGGS
jgi:MOSC domain-containing protein YiiM